jgi:hypothetical protein
MRASSLRGSSPCPSLSTSGCLLITAFTMSMNGFNWFAWRRTALETAQSAVERYTHRHGSCQSVSKSPAVTASRERVRVSRTSHWV